MGTHDVVSGAQVAQIQNVFNPTLFGLTPLPGTGGNRVVGMVVDPVGGSLYIALSDANGAKVYEYGMDGTLTDLAFPVLPGVFASGLALRADTGYLVVTTSNGAYRRYSDGLWYQIWGTPYPTQCPTVLTKTGFQAWSGMTGPGPLGVIGCSAGPALPIIRQFTIPAPLGFNTVQSMTFDQSYEPPAFTSQGRVLISGRVSNGMDDFVRLCYGELMTTPAYKVEPIATADIPGIPGYGLVICGMTQIDANTFVVMVQYNTPGVTVRIYRYDVLTSQVTQIFSEDAGISYSLAWQTTFAPTTDGRDIYFMFRGTLVRLNVRKGRILYRGFQLSVVANTGVVYTTDRQFLYMVNGTTLYLIREREATVVTNTSTDPMFVATPPGVPLSIGADILTDEVGTDRLAVDANAYNGLELMNLAIVDVLPHLSSVGDIRGMKKKIIVVNNGTDAHVDAMFYASEDVAGAGPFLLKGPVTVYRGTKAYETLTDAWASVQVKITAQVAPTSGSAVVTVKGQ